MLEQSIERLSGLIEQLIYQLELGRSGSKPATEELPTPTPAKLAKAENPAKVEKAPTPAPVPETPTVTYDEVKAATGALAKAKGRDAVLAVLGKFEVDNAVKLPQAMWAGYVEACNKALS